MHTQIPSIPSLCTQGQVFCFRLRACSDPSVPLCTWPGPHCCPPSSRFRSVPGKTHAFLCGHLSCVTSLADPAPQRPQLSQIVQRNPSASVFLQAPSAASQQIRTVAHWGTETSPASPSATTLSLLPCSPESTRRSKYRPTTASLGVSGLL